MHTFYEYRTVRNGKVINKYYAGTAIVEFPFFLCAHLAAKMCDLPADGYSKPYPICINIGSIVFLLIGLIYLRKLLCTLEITDQLVAFILIAITFGTNLFYYAVCEPGLTHIYSFTLISMFVYYARNYFITQKSKEMIYCALLLGIIILIRPVNVIILSALPFIAGSREKFIAGVKMFAEQKIILLFSALACASIISIQFVLYKIQCGSIFVDSYGDEGFNWLHPQILPFLFSYKKGFFLYTPLAFISLFGFVYLWKDNRFGFYSLVVFSICLIYVLSSWWNWWYGGSFSSRVMIDFYVFLALLLGYIYKSGINRFQKAIYNFIIIASIILCQFQTYQYRYYLIHWDQMNKEKYWDVFLKLP